MLSPKILFGLLTTQSNLTGLGQYLRSACVAIAILLTTARVSPAQTQPVSNSGIEGVILISHVPPRMARDTTPSGTPLANAPFVVKNETGAVASFTTDDQGRFRVLIAPGHYKVSQPANPGRIRRCGSWDVDVAVNKMSEVEWYCENGGARPDTRELRSVEASKDLFLFSQRGTQPVLKLKNIDRQTAA